MVDDPRRDLTEEERAALKALADLPDDQIDLTDPDSPPMKAEDFAGGIRGGFWKPVKKPVALRIDADVLAWFKRQGPGYQTRINEILREHMERQGKIGR
jgi:uncharacterized protein (DUF4415 family)